MSAIFTAEPAVPILIVGGGISGLSVAYYLARQGVRSVLLEKAGRLGGLIKTDHLDGCFLEAGPDSYIANKRALAELAAELGLAERIIGSNDESRRTYIAQGGRLIPMPQGMVMMVPGDIEAASASPLFSAESKARFLEEATRSPRTREADFTIGEFITDHFGPQVLDAVAEPLLSGVYGGDVAALSARSVLPRFVEYERQYGSLIRSVQRERQRTGQGSTFCSFEGGMQTVIDALAKAIRPCCEVVNGEAQSITRSDTGTWEVRLPGKSLKARHLVLACPAYANAQLLSESVPELAKELGEIPYSSAILATFVHAVDPQTKPMEGFGFLVPRSERRTVAAVTWVSTKWPFRTPPGRCAVRAFIVGAEAVTLAHRSDDQLLALAASDIRRFMPLDSEPLFTTLYRWPGSMPQYVLGHEARMNRVAALLAKSAGLYLVGSAYDGVGLPDCVRLAQRAANCILADPAVPASLISN